jgi:hypothetical protein
MDEMGMIEVAEFVNDVGPGPVWGMAAGDQCPVEPDRSCKRLLVSFRLVSQTTGTETALRDEVIDPLIGRIANGEVSQRCHSERSQK